jgi:hypothetical protein
MSILDDAIREHLELKRAHGADDSELKKLEDEAFGPPQRPDEADPFAAEAPTEFLAAPGEAPAAAPERGDEGARSGRRPDIADLQEAPPVPSDAAPAPLAPPAPADAVEDELSPAPDAPPPSPVDAADVPLPPPPGEAPATDLAPPPAATPEAPNDEGTGSFFDQFSTPADEATATGEDATLSDAPAAAPAPDEAPIPTDVAPATGDEATPSDAPAGSADDAGAPATDSVASPPAEEAPAPLTDAGAPTDEAPAADVGPDAEDPDSIVDQPTQMFDVQAHVDAEAAADAPPAGEGAPAPEENVPSVEPEQPQLNLRGPDAEVAGHPPAEADAEEGSAEFDFFNEQRLSDELDQALEAPLPPTDEHLAMPQYKDAPSEGGGIFDFQSGGETYEEDPSQEVLRRADEAEAAGEPAGDEESDTDYDPETGHEDVLEDTPRFLEDSPDDDDLWFEQKPPKDFDLD